MKSPVNRLGAKRLRQVMRWLHIIVGISLILFVYTPLSESRLFHAYLSIVAVPLVSLSGLALWQQARLNKFLSTRRAKQS